MLEQIDSSNTHLVQEITSPSGDVIRYQTVPIMHGKPMTAARLVNVFETKAAARMDAGLFTFDGRGSKRKAIKS